MESTKWNKMANSRQYLDNHLSPMTRYHIHFGSTTNFNHYYTQYHATNLYPLDLSMKSSSNRAVKYSYNSTSSTPTSSLSSLSYSSPSSSNSFDYKSYKADYYQRNKIKFQERARLNYYMRVAMESEQQREERLAKKREYMREYMRNRTDKELKGRSNKA
ncbi:hypothetical protein RDWZM_002795 [Blomia tropicalis]|uniref:Uncharacterized protein n=1 Tax=Blomia tropicalis TaxID=40697 RepID=A0A9Q0MED5_BLOTA|nr:hypothetical protein RDWZM_002795 [Blomia tropicalis]